MSENLTAEELADLKAKSLGEKFFDARKAAKMTYMTSWQSLMDHERSEHEKAALAFAASLSHDETASAVITSLRTALEEAAEREKYHGVARFVYAEEIAELMEAGARTWMPMELAKPVKNGSIIVMTTDDVPVIGQAFWHEHGDGTWALHWQSVDPKVDCWNDPITETNKGLACWQPVPEGPCDARVKAMDSPGPHMAALLRIKALEEASEALTARAEKAEQQRDAALVICRKVAGLTVEGQDHAQFHSQYPMFAALVATAKAVVADVSPSKSEADSNGQ